MPELPEVETVSRQLKKKVLGKKIVSFEIFDKKVAKSLDGSLNKTIEDIFRVNRYIIFKLNEGYLINHLRMTGHWHYVNSDNLDNFSEKWLSVKFNLSDGSFLTHNSIRRFGEIFYSENISSLLSKQPHEPLEISFEKFLSLVDMKPNLSLKNFLMHSNSLAGIGNIYAQEICYLMRLNPQVNISKLNLFQKKNLYIIMQTILEDSINHLGSTVDNYSNLEGSGGFQNKLLIYGKKFCPEKHVTEKIKMNGRGTTFCPVCQKNLI